ncbi:hypothetical protein M9Y10_020486 [Tritrichomonas musculus]|uniref:DUF3447 domain-containing protein n=1 Tax=Tritrichomonas musculus TaxID=1915356 RepID=A0ABR2HIC6_9EUKA
MSIEEVKEKMKRIQNAILEFLENESNEEENYANFVKLIAEYRMIEDKYEVKSILRLVNIIGNNHQRVHNFISKIEQILLHFKKDINKYFSNSEIFQLFKKNKRILLFLIEEKIIIIDEYFVSQVTKVFFVAMKYAEYFAPEINPFLTEEFIQKYQNKNSTLNEEEYIENIKKDVSEDFYDKRKKGENDSFLCELIRKNQVKEFSVYLNRNNISFDSCIPESIFETNPLLVDIPNIKMIEYAAFYGSNDIIRFLQINGEVKLTPYMWFYAIHSNNAELINYLEDNNILPLNNNYTAIFGESIKCHHIDVSKYIMHYLFPEKDVHNNIETNWNSNLYRYVVENYNYCFFPDNMKYKKMFLYLCSYDYYSFVKAYLEEGSININVAIKTLMF